MSATTTQLPDITPFQDGERPILSPTRVGQEFLLGIQDLADLSRVHRHTVRTHPENKQLQATLVNLLRVRSAAMVVNHDPQKAAFFIRNQPIPSFDHKTALQLVGEGRTEDVIGYLASIESGFVG